MDFVQLYTGIGRLDFWSYNLILAYAAWSVGAVFFLACIRDCHDDGSNSRKV